jgi:hypothetical protein
MDISNEHPLELLSLSDLNLGEVLNTEENPGVSLKIDTWLVKLFNYMMK